MQRWRKILMPRFELLQKNSTFDDVPQFSSGQMPITFHELHPLISFVFVIKVEFDRSFL